MLFPTLLLEERSPVGGRAWFDPFLLSDAMGGYMGVEDEMIERGGVFIHEGYPNNSAVWPMMKLGFENRYLPG